MLIACVIVLLVLLTVALRLPGFVLGLWLAAAIGWVANIVAIFNGPALALWTGMQIGRVIGVFLAPLGAVLGYF